MVKCESWRRNNVGTESRIHFVRWYITWLHIVFCHITREHWRPSWIYDRIVFLNNKCVSKISFSYEIYFEKWYYMLFSVKKKIDNIIYKIVVGGHLGFMHEQYFKIKNSGRNEFSMPITGRKVVLHNHLFLTNGANVLVILVFLTDKKQNGHQKGNFVKKEIWKHIISQIRDPYETEYVIKLLLPPPPPKKKHTEAVFWP